MLKRSRENKERNMEDAWGGSEPEQRSIQSVVCPEFVRPQKIRPTTSGAGEQFADAAPTNIFKKAANKLRSKKRPSGQKGCVYQDLLTKEARELGECFSPTNQPTVAEGCSGQSPSCARYDYDLCRKVVDLLQPSACDQQVGSTDVKFRIQKNGLFLVSELLEYLNEYTEENIRELAANSDKVRFQLFQTRLGLMICLHKHFRVPQSVSFPEVDFDDNSAASAADFLKSKEQSPRLEYRWFQDALPDEILLKIFSYLTEVELGMVACMCKRFMRIAYDDSIWEQLFRVNFNMECAYGLELPNGKDSTWRDHVRQMKDTIIVDPKLAKLQAMGRSLGHANLNPKRIYYSTINESILAADDNDVIVVKPGVYRECFVITKNITILGASPTLTHTSPIHCDLMDAQMNRWESTTVPNPSIQTVHSLCVDPDTNLVGQQNVGQIGNVMGMGGGQNGGHTMIDDLLMMEDEENEELMNEQYNCAKASSSKSIGSSSVIIEHNSQTVFLFKEGSVGKLINVQVRLQLDNNLHSKLPCIEITDSAPMLRHCLMTSNCMGAACVYVHGKGTKPFVFNSIISQCSHVGIFVENKAEGHFFGNDISKNKLAGIWIKNGASPIFKKNSIHSGKDVGVFIFHNGDGILEENDIYRNRIAGIEVKTGGNPQLIRNYIHHGKTGGVYIHDHGGGVLESNKIFANTFAGVWITSHSNPTLRNNHIFDGKQGGVYIFGDGKGLLENNNIHGNTLAGIQIRTRSNPIIKNNIIHDGKHGGVYVHDGGMGHMEGNEICANALAGVWITTGSNPTLKRNKVHSGKQVGVYIYDNGKGLLMENDIYNHNFSGVQIRTGSNPIIRNNRIFGGRNGGVLIYNGGLGLLEENEIFKNTLAGVWIKTDSNPVLRRNKIYDGQEGGVCIYQNGLGVLEENEIFRNAMTGVLITSGSNPILRKNRIYDGFAAGIEITNGAKGVLDSNEVSNNIYDGISLATGVSPTLLNNHIINNRRIVDEAVKQGACTFLISGDRRYPMHDFYRCITCGTVEGDAVCVNCITHCHKGHHVEFIRHDRFFCDCGAGSLRGGCGLMRQVNASTTTTPLTRPGPSNLRPAAQTSEDRNRSNSAGSDSQGTTTDSLQSNIGVERQSQLQENGCTEDGGEIEELEFDLDIHLDFDHSSGD
eukprot:Nk52_evm15s293 gene=Nk52_evmTU15s293